MFAVALLLAALAGCGPAHISNDEATAETLKCEAAGMEARVVLNEWDYSIARINCIPKDSK